MGLKAVVKTLEGLPDGVAELYTKSGDSYVLDIEGVDDHPTVASLSKTLKTIRSEKKDFEKKVKDLEGKVSGIDIDSLKDIDLKQYEADQEELKALKLKQEQEKKQKLIDEKNWEKLELKQKQDYEAMMADLDAKHKTQVETLTNQLKETAEKSGSEITSTLSELKSHLKDKQLTTELAAVKGNIPVLMPHISPFIDVKKEDGDKAHKAVVIDGNGNQRLNGTGQPMTIKELVNEFMEKPEFEVLFEKEKKPGGSGSDGNLGDSANTADNPFSTENFNRTQQALLLKKDPQRYEALKKAAEVENKE